MRLGPEVEDISHTFVQLLSIRRGSFQPVGPVQIYILNEQRVESIHISHQDLENLKQQISSGEVNYLSSMVLI